MISHLNLKKKNLLSDSVSLQTDESGFEFLIINHKKFNAAFTLHGAHLIHFQPAQQEPIIWLSKTAIFNDQKAIRGGVPVCWPWFGAAGESLGANLPSHGFARTSKWSVKNINDTADGVELELSLKDSEATRELWPFKFEVVLKATFTDTLKLQLISNNTDSKAFSYRAALHTYLNISAPEACQISGLNTQYTDSLNAGHPESGDGNLLINAPIDSIYQKAPAAILLDDQGFKRQLTITDSGNDSEVVWNPWIAGAKAFADMPDDGYQTMVCIESAITKQPGQSIPAGETHTLTTYIS